jgi:hypothetical protein
MAIDYPSNYNRYRLIRERLRQDDNNLNARHYVQTTDIDRTQFYIQTTRIDPYRNFDTTTDKDDTGRRRT